MQYFEEAIDWQDVHELSDWLDSEVSSPYQNQPLAQDWARISKVAEELGEAIEAFIGSTGQNPRKGVVHTPEDLYEELADVALTAIYALDHFGVNPRLVIRKRQRHHMNRVGLRNYS